jgi:hypothetical protein
MAVTFSQDEMACLSFFLVEKGDAGLTILRHLVHDRFRFLQRRDLRHVGRRFRAVDSRGFNAIRGGTTDSLSLCGAAGVCFATGSGCEILSLIRFKSARYRAASIAGVSPDFRRFTTKSSER